jgi:hypothetical protein
MSAVSPNWADDVQRLFAAPSWVSDPKVPGEWRDCMKPYDIDLSSCVSVKQSAETIYDHLASHSMPLTSHATQYWPDWALATLRTWINRGCPETADAPAHPRATPIPPPGPQRGERRLRRNILDLDEQELADYRAALVRLGAQSTDPAARWQQIAYVHTDWCLHYQEAFLLWHRAHLLWFEDQLGMAVPYWNFMDPNAPVDGTREGGLVEPFRDLTYVDPATGEELPNPLRIAVAKDGVSAVCAGGVAPPGVDCRYVQRWPVLYSSGDDQRREREAWVGMLSLFQDQVTNALSWPVFSSPEGSPGYPWANLPSFAPPQPDSDYPHRTDFDGLYEQPHDNFHGWLGPEMADNSYTAFDPLFWSLHSNIDRVFEEWLRAHPGTKFTSSYALQPFVGSLASSVDFTDPNRHVYTTIGDMAKDCRALGYDYEAPKRPDSRGAPPAPFPAAQKPERHLYVLFPDTRCILESYFVDVFVNLPAPTPEDVTGHGLPHYVGRMTRLGMGVEDERGRCVSTGVTRILDATHNVIALGLEAGAPVELSMVVTHVATGRTAAPDEYLALPGFVPTYSWGSGWPGGAA